jgi:hypothetical protein
MRRNTVHESQTRVSQAKFLLVLLVLKFTVCDTPTFPKTAAAVEL